MGLFKHNCVVFYWGQFRFSEILTCYYDQGLTSGAENCFSIGSFFPDNPFFQPVFFLACGTKFWFILYGYDFFNKNDPTHTVLQNIGQKRVCIVNWHPAILSQTSNRFNYLRQNVEYSIYSSI